MDKEKYINKLNEELDELKGKELLYFNMRDSVQEARCTNRIFGIQYALNCARLLDEPQKVKVPTFVVEYINWCKQHDWQLTAIATSSNAEYFESHSESSGLHEWINENYATFLIAIATDDFEVEEKLKFIVKQKDGFYIEGLAMIEGKTYAKTFDSEAEAYKWAELCSGMIEKV